MGSRGIKIEDGLVDPSGTPDYAKMHSDNIDKAAAVSNDVQAKEDDDAKTAAGFDLLERNRPN